MATKKHNILMSGAFVSLLISAAIISSTHAQSQYPVMEKVAQKVIDKYQTSSCEELMMKKQKPPSPPSQGEQKAMQLLHQNPQMREQFLNKVAGPIANKMFECGMIP